MKEIKMIEYRIKISGNKRKVPVMEFSDPQYDLAAELFLAERGLIGKLIEFLSVDETEFGGNVFTLKKTDDEIKLYNNQTEEILTIPQADFTELLTAYYREYKRLKK